MSMAHSRVTRFEVAACSAAEIVTNRNENSLITQSHNPLLFSAAPVFAGGNMGSTSGCTFQILYCDVKIDVNKKKR